MFIGNKYSVNGGLPNNILIFEEGFVFQVISACTVIGQAILFGFGLFFVQFFSDLYFYTIRYVLGPHTSISQTPSCKRKNEFCMISCVDAANNVLNDLTNHIVVE